MHVSLTFSEITVNMYHYLSLSILYCLKNSTRKLVRSHLKRGVHVGLMWYQSTVGTCRLYHHLPLTIWPWFQGSLWRHMVTCWFLSLWWFCTRTVREMEEITGRNHPTAQLDTSSRALGFAAGISGPSRPASLSSRVWARLPSGLILPENQDASKWIIWITQLELRWTDYRPHGQTILFELFGYFTLYFT